MPEALRDEQATVEGGDAVRQAPQSRTVGRVGAADTMVGGLVRPACRKLAEGTFESDPEGVHALLRESIHELAGPTTELRVGTGHPPGDPP